MDFETVFINPLTETFVWLDKKTKGINGLISISIDQVDTRQANSITQIRHFVVEPIGKIFLSHEFLVMTFILTLFFNQDNLN